VSSTLGIEALVSVDQDSAIALSRELHQATQPITVLQGTLELALLTASTTAEYRRVIERSLKELQRVTECFEHLRAFIQLQSASDIQQMCSAK
jgi:hypothetical protein